MTQPPEEPSSQDGWQPPGPVPPPQQPGEYPGYGLPYDRPAANPYGGDTTGYYQPIDSGGMSSSVKVVLGVVIGIFAGFCLWFVAAIGFASSATDNEFLFYAALAPLVVPAPLLIWKTTRPWAAGLLMGTAAASIGMSSLCSAMINSLEGGA